MDACTTTLQSGRKRTVDRETQLYHPFSGRARKLQNREKMAKIPKYRSNRGFPRGEGISFFAEIVPPGGKSTIPGGIFFFFHHYPGGSGYVQKYKPWSTHTDSSGGCAMD